MSLAALDNSSVLPEGCYFGGIGAEGGGDQEGDLLERLGLSGFSPICVKSSSLKERSLSLRKNSHYLPKSVSVGS